jgi:hypothetical protein
VTIHAHFKRIAMTREVAETIVEHIVDRTFKDHYERRECQDNEDCHHIVHGTLDVARFLESNMTIGKKRARLDLPCPYTSEDTTVVWSRRRVMRDVGYRLRQFGDDLANLRPTIRRAMKKIADEVLAYEGRNEMEVLAAQLNLR